ncbi:LRR domain containing protein [Parasponia andersonii]|uniref:LRR domain containing protein n=1 Tax=Parasponia andersonii TaxID=3476 RepID=A0A2P5APQ0_PARAD|nr:LRR domain containing protein [Parasponia andersonii]
MMRIMSRDSSSALIFTFYVACSFGLTSLTLAQTPLNQTQPTTHSSEVRALNSVFDQWKIKANTQQWNISGEPCSGAAVQDSASFDDGTFNPFIKCDCSFNNGALCHITQLKVYALDVTGPIPEELWTLTFLYALNLAQNYLTGSVSPSIGNLTHMQYLSLGINALSGKIPREVGQLTELIALSFGANNFSGTLPSELGNLTQLQQLYIDSSGVSGEIPSTFANIRSLNTLWASDVEFTGKIPDFIGNWSNLTTLRLQGNSFEGPIPSSFANLTSLTEL